MGTLLGYCWSAARQSMPRMKVSMAGILGGRYRSGVMPRPVPRRGHYYLTVRDPTAVEPQWNADRQVNARNRFGREILRRKTR
jgi:hypothetical protein